LKIKNSNDSLEIKSHNNSKCNGSEMSGPADLIHLFILMFVQFEEIICYRNYEERQGFLANYDMARF
jgi:hypothetical protein